MAQQIIFATLLCIFFSLHGFFADTPIKTATGYVPIAQIKWRDKVISTDLHGSYQEKLVTHSRKKLLTQYIKIDIGSDSLRVFPEQYFYLPTERCWKQAQHLTIHDVLALNGEEHICAANVEIVHKKALVYEITVADYHTFCITQHNIIAHNVVPAIGIVLAWAFGAGGMEFASASISAGIIAFGTWIGVKFYKDHKKQKQHVELIADCSTPHVTNATKEECNDAQAPGKPTEKDGYIPPKNYDGKKVKNPNGSGYGWPAKDGSVWVPSGPNGHGGPHWDVEYPGRKKNYDNVFPGGKVRGKRK